MWILPWEKLPPLVLGPLLIVAGIFVFLLPDAKSPEKWLEALVWGIACVVVGLALTAYGTWKLRTAEK
jgi:uncharacterized membrane protein